MTVFYSTWGRQATFFMGECRIERFNSARYVGNLTNVTPWDYIGSLYSCMHGAQKCVTPQCETEKMHGGLCPRQGAIR